VEDGAALVQVRRLSLVALIALGSCASNAVAPNPMPSRSILFIGNSLTYFNDLPRTFKEVALSTGDTIEVEAVTGPNLALIDHVKGATIALDVIASRKWDIVVLQQGPSSLGISQDTLILAAKLLEPHIRKAGARPALYMVWPAADRSKFFESVHRSYRLAADSINGLFLPVGDAWQSAWRRDEALPLYGPDGFHPTPLATYLAAIVMYEVFTGKDARALADIAYVNGSKLHVPAATIRLLQAAAHETNAANN
jgi:hypothetical protein